MPTPACCKSVLWIDDDADGVDLSARFLRSGGVSVDVAFTGGDGLALASTKPYSLILLDLRLPDASGLQVLKSMTSLGVRSPVVLVTGFASLPTAVDAIKLGAVDVRSKPLFADDALVLLETYGNEDAAAMQRLTRLAVESPQLSLEETAQKTGLERHALERLVREQAGLCWRDWRRRTLMEHAATAITSSDTPLKVLAEKFGYSSIHSFSKAFREVWGVSPGRYRRDAAIVPAKQPFS